MLSCWHVHNCLCTRTRVQTPGELQQVQYGMVFCTPSVSCYVMGSNVCAAVPKDYVCATELWLRHIHKV